MLSLAPIMCLLFLFSNCYCDPPVYNFSYYITFEQTYQKDGIQHRTAGHVFYDPLNNRERIGRMNGQYNFFCYGVMPNVSTSCYLYTVNNKRWIVFPEKKSCCFCCDSSHGCGILRPDWLAGALYVGEHTIDGQVYDKWSKNGDLGYNYIYVARDEDRTPKRLYMEHAWVTEYIGTFNKGEFPDSVYALPPYCNTEKPTSCPLSSICGKLRGQQATQ